MFCNKKSATITEDEPATTPITIHFLKLGSCSRSLSLSISARILICSHPFLYTQHLHLNSAPYLQSITSIFHYHYPIYPVCEMGLTWGIKMHPTSPLSPSLPFLSPLAFPFCPLLPSTHSFLHLSPSLSLSLFSASLSPVPPLLCSSLPTVCPLCSVVF